MNLLFAIIHLFVKVNLNMNFWKLKVKLNKKDNKKKKYKIFFNNKIYNHSLT